MAAASYSFVFCLPALISTHQLSQFDLHTLKSAFPASRPPGEVKIDFRHRLNQRDGRGRDDHSGQSTPFSILAGSFQTIKSGIHATKASLVTLYKIFVMRRVDPANCVIS